MPAGVRRCVLALAFLITAFARVLPAADGSAPNPTNSALSIRWVTDSTDTNRVAVEVSGWSEPALRALRQGALTDSQWQRILSVYSAADDATPAPDQPAMLGRYTLSARTLRFAPQFPLAPGVNYRAFLHPDASPGLAPAATRPLTSSFQMPRRRITPSTVVSRIYPTADVLPENLLKFYLHFSAPMSRGHIYERIHLRKETGAEVDLPFLQIDEELWNPALTRLTLLIDPGRIKRGVRPLEEIGPALEAGHRYTLTIDSAWPDADGVPLRESFNKSFRVSAPDRAPIDLQQWAIEIPAAASRAPLVVTFPKPMDHALAQRLIRVARGTNSVLAGEVTLAEAERRWTFTPSELWQRGPHTLLVQTEIEDLAGNNVGKAFEVDAWQDGPRSIDAATARRPFQIR